VAERALGDRVDQTIDAILKRGDATAALRDQDLAPLARLAADLRHYPGPAFKSRLRAKLEREGTMSSAVLQTSVREGLSTITPYLRVREPGLVDFLGHVFGAIETSHGADVARMHREVRVGSSTMLIDEGDVAGAAPARPAEFHVYVEDVDAAFDRAIAAGATSLGAPADRPYGERSGFVRDAYGNHWFIATHLGESHVPRGLGTVTPFVHAKGASEYIEFLKRAFGAVEEMPRDIIGGAVRFAKLRIGNAAIELGEAEPSTPPMPGAFYLTVRDVDRVYEEAVGAGARPLSPPAEGERGATLARIEDPIGNHWLIASPA
jgi:PhnB protein